jgi:hypothetical protein
MRRVSAKFVPRFLTVEQQENRLPVPTTLLQELHGGHNCRRRGMDLRIWSGNEVSNFAVEVVRVSKIEERG